MRADREDCVTTHLQLPLGPYGDLPGHVRGSDTSRAAAESVRTTAPIQQAAVLAYLAQCGPQGATVDEIEEALGLRHQSASARMTEAVRMGLAEDSGERRRTRSGRTAAVWVVVQP
jgi:hypothetical protein